MTTKLLCLFTCLFLLIFLQVKSQGITFEENLSWQQAKEKAKKENKYIFVDCYATRCGPCKQMEKEVYPSDKAGNFLTITSFRLNYILIQLNRIMKR